MFKIGDQVTIIKNTSYPSSNLIRKLAFVYDISPASNIGVIFDEDEGERIIPVWYFEKNELFNFTRQKKLKRILNI